MNFKDCIIEKKRLDEMMMAEYNPREITDNAYKGLGSSIDKFGLMIPIVWNKRSGNIVSGHQRYKHLVESGEVDTDVVVVDLDGNEEVALNITLNNPHIRGRFTAEVVKLLRLSEAQIGSSFNDIRLDALFNRMKFLEESQRGGGGFGGGDGEPSGPVAIVTCPKCRSRWTLSDRKVIVNTTNGKGSK